MPKKALSGVSVTTKCARDCLDGHGANVLDIFGGRCGGTADQLIRQVVANELGSEERDHSHWMFRLETATKNGEGAWVPTRWDRREA
jgi:hypothetical protein